MIITTNSLHIYNILPYLLIGRPLIDAKKREANRAVQQAVALDLRRFSRRSTAMRLRAPHRTV